MIPPPASQGHPIEQGTHMALIAQEQRLDLETYRVTARARRLAYGEPWQVRG